MIFMSNIYIYRYSLNISIIILRMHKRKPKVLAAISKPELLKLY